MTVYVNYKWIIGFECRLGFMTSRKHSVSFQSCLPIDTQLSHRCWRFWKHIARSLQLWNCRFPMLYAIEQLSCPHMSRRTNVFQHGPEPIEYNSLYCEWRWNKDILLSPEDKISVVTNGRCQIVQSHNSTTYSLKGKKNYDWDVYTVRE